MLSLSNANNDVTIVIKGIEYQLNMSFDNVLRWFDLIDSKLSEKEKVIQTFLMFIGDVDATPDDLVNVFKLVEEAVSEHPYGNGMDNYTKQDENGLDAHFERPYDYKVDAEAIYASFMFDYHIDLIDQKGKMSWFKFKALLDNLSDKSPLMKIVRIRKTDLGQIAKDYKDNPKYIGMVSDQKDYYSLAQTPEERQAKKDYELSKAMAQLR